MPHYPVVLVVDVPGEIDLNDLIQALSAALEARPDFSDTGVRASVTINATVDTPSGPNAENWVKGVVSETLHSLGAGAPQFTFESIQPAVDEADE